MNTCKLCFPGFEAGSARAIRWELFLHRDVREVLLTPRPDTLLIVYQGVADPQGWAATLRSAKFPAAVFSADPTGTLESGPRNAAA